MDLSFPSKLFLFGEYSILEKSDAILCPLGNFKANVTYQNLRSEILDGFIQYAKSTLMGTEFSEVIDFQQVHDSRQKGWSVKSDIPDGKGLGSSGAFIAAFYESFKTSKLGKEELIHLLGLLENYFHSVSSGLDPYISYTKKSLVLKGKQVESIDADKIFSSIKLYLFDSKISREASAYVRIFKNKLLNKKYSADFHEQYIPLVNNIIKDLSVDNKLDFHKLCELSKLQLLFFPEMFPQKIKSIACALLETNHTCMKLCGAGGGGYYQVFTINENLDESFDQSEIIQPLLV